MQDALKRTGRILFWAGVVLAAANVEKIGERFGLTDLSQGRLWWLSWLVSPVAYAIALVALGVGLAAWVDWLARKWDAHHPTADQQLASNWTNLDNLAGSFQRFFSNQEPPSMELLGRTNAKYTTLRKLGLPCPDLETGDGPVWLAVNMVFAQAVAPLLKDGHVAEAREVARDIVSQQVELAKNARDAVNRQRKEQPWAWSR